MYRNIFLVGSWTIASRLTGFLRDMALAALMGGGALNDAYVAAIKLPNQFRQIFGEGSFNSAYLPTYTRVLESAGPEAASRRHRQRLPELLGLADEPGRSQPHEQGHVEIDDAQQSDLREYDQREHLTREAARFLGTCRLKHAGVGRQVG